MKFSTVIFSFLCIIANGLANSDLQEFEDRYISPKETDQLDVELHQGLRLESDVSLDPEYQRNPETDFQRDQINYNKEQKFKRDFNLDGNERPSTRIFRTYGRGKAQVTRQGETVYVSNVLGKKAYKKPMAVKILDKDENEIKPTRHRGVCRECPTDQTVIATKGNNFAILPEPCQINPKMWSHHSGPQPGSKIQEGVHSVRGYIGPKKKFCQYHYQVLVRKCEPLKVNADTVTECSAENVWGSICNISCGNEKEPVGPTTLECQEDLTWSNPMPVCKSKTDCSAPKVKTNSKISCYTSNMVQVEGDIIPSGSTCKFMQNEKQVSIACKDGKWRISRKSKSPPKKEKQKSENKVDSCNPNPCQNGGTCLRPDSSKGTPICKCRPQTQGVHCEMRECYYNICENDGMCFIRNQERICYCSSEYSGDTCQHYTKS